MTPVCAMCHETTIYFFKPRQARLKIAAATRSVIATLASLSRPELPGHGRLPPPPGPPPPVMATTASRKSTQSMASAPARTCTGRAGLSGGVSRVSLYSGMRRPAALSYAAEALRAFGLAAAV